MPPAFLPAEKEPHRLRADAADLSDRAIYLRGAEKISQRAGRNGPHCTRHAGNHFRSLLFLSHFFPEALQKAFI